MKILAIQSSPNVDGLTSRLAQAALQGAQERGAEIELVHLNKLSIHPCRACGTGWGHHRQPAAGGLKVDECVIEDDFAELQAKIVAADGVIFSNPVYFGDLSESAKTFLDRLRRCQWLLQDKSPLKGKHLVCIAAAGGSGSGAPQCLVHMEDLLIRFLQMKRVVSLPVTRFNQEVFLDAARHTGQLLVDMISKQ